jgi:hypothetical protein
MLLMQPSLSKFIKITPCSRASKLVNFQIISTLSNELWNKILPSLSQAFTTHHPNVFTPILLLSEGRAGIAWVPSNTPSDIKRLSLSPDVFSFLLLLYYPLSDYGLDDQAIGVRSPAGANNFSSSLCVQTGSGVHPASCTVGNGGPFSGGKARPERDADHSPPSSAEVVNE